MAEKRLNTRVILKHDEEGDWQSAVNFSPLPGEMIIYDADANNPLPRIKIGNGSTNVNDLPFLTPSITNEEIDAICGTTLEN